MNNLRRFAYAVLLAVTTLTLPQLASASDAKGHFTLKHSVLWGGLEIPAGDYAYAYDPVGTAPVLTLHEESAGRSYMLLVNATESTKATDASLLLIEPSAAGRYVSAMQLPEIGITLDFVAPTHTVVARTVIASATAGQ